MIVSASLLPALILGLFAGPLGPGNHLRTVRMGEGEPERPYRIHVPAKSQPDQPMPVVLALHPFATNAPMMASISRLDEVADREGFLVVYPNGTGRGAFLHWNVGAWSGDKADDVAYLVKVLDDVATIARVDPARVFATGFSNGGMMCYRLAAEIPDRIAAIAPVAGTMTTTGKPPKAGLKRPVPVLHIHGTEDSMVPFARAAGPVQNRVSSVMGTVDESIQAWAQANGCPEKTEVAEIPTRGVEGLSITRTTHGPGRDGAEVVLYTIVGGGHIWPGWDPPGRFLGKAPTDFNASEVIWQFFQKHPRPLD